MLRARELRDAGWYPTAIRRLLTQEGHGSPSLFTIQVWTNPRYMANHSKRRQSRGLERSAERTRFRLSGSSEAYRVAFMERLHSDGVPCSSIARVCCVVFGMEVAPNEVRRVLRDVMPVHGNSNAGRAERATA
jgi:hypothetical protein